MMTIIFKINVLLATLLSYNLVLGDHYSTYYEYETLRENMRGCKEWKLAS